MFHSKYFVKMFTISYLKIDKIEIISRCKITEEECFCSTNIRLACKNTLKDSKQLLLNRANTRVNTRSQTFLRPCRAYQRNE